MRPELARRRREFAQRPAPRVIEAAVTPEGRVVAVQPSVERLNVRTGTTSRSPCGAIDMDAATRRAARRENREGRGFLSRIRVGGCSRRKPV